MDETRTVTMRVEQCPTVQEYAERFKDHFYSEQYSGKRGEKAWGTHNVGRWPDMVTESAELQYNRFVAAQDLEELGRIVGHDIGVTCSECERTGKQVVEFGPYDYENFSLCRDCLKKAIGLLDETKITLAEWREANKQKCPECGGDAYPYRATPERICYSCQYRWEGDDLTEPMPRPWRPRVFVWQGEGVLQDWTSGMMVVVAENIEEARAVMIRTYSEYYGYDPQQTPEGLEREPKVVEMDQPHAFFVCGGG